MQPNIFYLKCLVIFVTNDVFCELLDKNNALIGQTNCIVNLQYSAYNPTKYSCYIGDVLIIDFTNFGYDHVSCEDSNQRIRKFKPWNSVMHIYGKKMVSEDNTESRWKCSFSTFWGSVNFEFDVHIVHPNIIINNESYEPFKKKLGYYEVGNYNFTEGEIIDFRCEKHNNKMLQLMYYESNDKKLIQTKKENSTMRRFVITMKANNNNSYIDCIYADEYVFRTFFTYRSTSEIVSKLNVVVNDLRLVPKYNTTKYQYKFFEGDDLTISCELTTNTSRFIEKNIKFTFISGVYTKIYFTAIEDSMFKQKLRLKTVNKRMDGVSLSFHINDTHGIMSNITILFLRATYFDVRILGLSPTKIQHQYQYDFNDWLIDYWYRIGETLKVTCLNEKYSRTKTLSWIYLDKEIFPENFMLIDKIQAIKEDFVLNATQNMSRIICKSKSHMGTKSVAILLHLIPDTLYGRDNWKLLRIIAGSIVAGILMLVIVTTVLCKFYKRSLKRQYIHKENDVQTQKSLKLSSLNTQSKIDNTQTRNDGVDIINNKSGNSCGETTTALGHENKHKSYDTAINYAMLEFDSHEIDSGSKRNQEPTYSEVITGFTINDDTYENINYVNTTELKVLKLKPN